MRHYTMQNMRQKLSIVITAFIMLLFIAINPIITNAQENQSISLTKGLAFVKQPTPETRAGKNDLDLASDSNKRLILDDETLKMIALVNQERVEAGLKKLESDDVLIKLAQEKGLDMIRFNYFGHYSKRLGTVYDQLDQENLIYQAAAENLAKAPNYQRAFQSLLASPAHRSNILNPRFTKIGIGVIRSGPFGKIIVQIMTD